MADYARISNRGVKCARFYVLKNTLMPSILIETGFLSNNNEAYKLSLSKTKEDIAKGILKGVRTYAYEFERTKGFSE
ncbi:N-acetylmuramoyl-L-alanine amidase [bacterium]|nr:N-acetylmuramoyl-L-alanine amidase [bacterium]